MVELIVSVSIGVICIILGISHTKGNLASLHSYHRKRVSEEDRLPFGRLIGLGMIVIGCSLIVFGGFSAASTLLKNTAYVLIGTVVMFIGMAVGFGLSFYALIKYNKGIF